MTTSLHTGRIDTLKVPSQVRKDFDPVALQGLADSIRESGLQQPLLVRREQGALILIDGERRLRACQLLKMKEVPMLVVDDPLTVVDALTRQLACNLQRENLGVLERADGIQALMDQTSMTAEQVARRLGLSAATVSRTLAVLKLPDALKAQVASGQISQDAAYLLARVPEPARQASLAAGVVKGDLTRDALIRKIKSARRAEASQENGAPRVTAVLGGGRTVTLAGKGLSLESMIDWLEQLLNRARKSKSQGLSLETFVRTLRDQATT